MVFGILFGFLLQKGGATKHDVIVGQLLLTDFTVLKIMLSAVLTGMIGIYLMKTLGWVELSPKSGSMGSNIIGGLIFGVGFAVLGYCPGTIAGAIGNGYLARTFQCAAKRRGFSVGEIPTRHLSLQPVATGAVVEANEAIEAFGVEGRKATRRACRP